MNKFVGAVKNKKGAIVKGIIGFGVIVAAAAVAVAMKKDEGLKQEGQAIVDAFTDEEPVLDIQPATEE